VRWYDSSHPSLADTLKDLGDQAKNTETIVGLAATDLLDADAPPR